MSKSELPQELLASVWRFWQRRRLAWHPGRALDTAPVDLRLIGRTLFHTAMVGVAAGLLGAAFFAALEFAQHVLLDDLAGYVPLRAHGEAPSADWVHSLLAGSRHLGDPHAASGDIFYADLPTSGMWLAAGRPERPIHERERLRLDMFARIADALLRSSLGV